MIKFSLKFPLKIWKTSKIDKFDKRRNNVKENSDSTKGVNFQVGKKINKKIFKN